MSSVIGKNKKKQFEVEAVSFVYADYIDDTEVTFTFSFEASCSDDGTPTHNGLNSNVNGSGDNNEIVGRVVQNASCDNGSAGIFIEFEGKSDEGDVPFWETVGICTAAGAGVGGITAGGPGATGGGIVGFAGGVIVGTASEAFDDEWELHFVIRWKVCCVCSNEQGKRFIPRLLLFKGIMKNGGKLMTVNSILPITHNRTLYLFLWITKDE